MAEYEDQMKTKPIIDDLIQQYLSGDIKEKATNFVAFLRDNKLEPRWGAKNSYNVKYKSKRVCIVKINQDELDLRLGTQYNEEFNSCFSEESDEIKQFLLSTITYCSGCGTCKPGLDLNVLGQDLAGACFNPVIQIINPNEQKFALAKRLVLLRKQSVAEGIAPKTTYISVKKRG